MATPFRRPFPIGRRKREEGKIIGEFSVSSPALEKAIKEGVYTLVREMDFE